MDGYGNKLGDAIRYNGAIVLTESCKLHAIAIKDGYQASAVSYAEYIVDSGSVGPAPGPTEANVIVNVGSVKTAAGRPASAPRRGANSRDGCAAGEGAVP